MKKVGLALSGSGARSYIYIGMFEILEKHKISISAISGTSGGSMIAALYALDFNTEEMMEAATNVDWNDLLRFTIPDKAILDDESIEIALRKVFGNARFKDTKVPLYITSTDIMTGKEHIFEKGPIWKAVRASISVPGVMAPVEHDGMRLIDGAIVDPVPVDILKMKGMGKIIAVDINTVSLQKKQEKRSQLSARMAKSLFQQEMGYLKKYLERKRYIPGRWTALLNPKMIYYLIKRGKPPEMINTLMKSNDILQNELTKEKIKNSRIDLLISPDVSKIGFFAFDNVELAREIGKKVALSNLRKIKALTR